MPDKPESLKLLIAQLRHQQRQSWRRGERLFIETLAKNVPELQGDLDGLLDLAYAEFCLRDEAGEQPALEEYQRRFPQLAEPLRMQLEVHRVLAGTETIATTQNMSPQSKVDAPAARAGVGSTDSMIGAYQVLGELGGGGMGVVYKAKHTILGRVVALKTMRAELAAEPNWAKRFEREIRVCARLTHPHVVRIEDVGLHEGKPYYTMPLLTGGSLAQHRPRYFSQPREALVLVEKIARAVHHAHEQGILHRDLKPANVLLDDQGEPQVTDFGLAKISDEDVELTRTGAVLGTPAYMAPEQAAGRSRQIGPLTDVWALGVILYELLLGRRPFLGDNEDLRGNILKTGPPLPRALRPDLHPDLERILLRCLEKEPAQRYPSAAALAEDLSVHLGGQPLAPERWRRRMRQRIRKHPIRSAIQGLGAVMLVGLAVALVRNEMNRPDPPIVLLGPTGEPKDYHPLVGADLIRVLSATTDQPFKLQSVGPKLALLQLEPPPPWQDYRLETEVRHERSFEGEVGVFVGYVRHNSPQGRYHTFWAAGFSERGRNWGNVSLFLSRYHDASGDIHGDPVDPHHTFPCSPQTDPVSPWHHLAVDVSTRELRAFLDGKCVGAIPAEQIENKYRFMLSEIPAIETETPPRRVAGFFVQDSEVFFRNAIIRPLP
jgi:serine/threonine protein kinase